MLWRLEDRNKTVFIFVLEYQRLSTHNSEDTHKKSSNYIDSRSTYKKFTLFITLKKEVDNAIKIPFVSAQNYKIPEDKYNN